MRTLLISFLTFMIITHAAIAKSGGNGITSSGGDRIAETKDMAWFTGNHLIKACLDVAPNYPYSKIELQKKITEAAKKWKFYYQEHMKLNFEEDKINNINRPKIAFDLEFGTCDKNTELTFFFGKKSESIKEEIEKNYNDPIGLSLLLDYNWDTGIGKGEVWIDDILKKFEVLHINSIDSIILHELGHVFGNGHYQNTIMDENIAYDLSWMNPKGGYLEDDPIIGKILTSIDKFRYLCFDYSSSWSFSGYWPKNPYVNISENKEIFEDITGLPFQSKLDSIEITNQSPNNRVVIKFKFQNQVTLIPIILSKYIETSEKVGAMFKVVTLQSRANESSYYSYEFESKPRQISGKIAGKSGRHYGITLRLNELNQTLISLATPEGDNIPILIKGEEPEEYFQGR